MTKKQNTIVFILVGTVINLIISISIIILLTLAAFMILKEKAQFSIPFTMVGGLLIGMLIYQKLTMWVIKKFSLEDKLDPLFTRKYKKK